VDRRAWWTALYLCFAACGESRPDKPAVASATACSALSRVTATIDDLTLCADTAAVLGHGMTQDRTRIDVGTDLLNVRGADRSPRQYLDIYPDDRPFGVTLSPVFTTTDGTEYTLFLGIGGLTRKDWSGPVSQAVIPDELAYGSAKHPTAIGAYVQMSRKRPTPNGLDIGTYTAKSGHVTFRDYDFKTGHYTGAFDLVFVSRPPLGPSDVTGDIVVKGEFRLPPRS
jgi:hypothetical protein